MSNVTRPENWPMDRNGGDSDETIPAAVVEMPVAARGMEVEDLDTKTLEGLEEDIAVVCFIDSFI